MYGKINQNNKENEHSIILTPGDLVIDFFIFLTLFLLACCQKVVQVPELFA